MTAENHYLSKDELTPHQKSKIAELREKASKHLAKYPDYDTDFSLLRWLMGWDYDIGEFMEYYSDLTAYSIRLDVILPKIRETLDVLSSLRLDEISVANVGELNARIRSMSNVCDYFPGKPLRAEEATGRKLGAKLVIDLDEFSMDVLYPPALNVYLNLLTLLQNILASQSLVCEPLQIHVLALLFTRSNSPDRTLLSL
ncbi:hypothetical protein ANCDUO_05314 [Ancylostoma duodenale]|uniref:Uncharacterized protein n=1 Tax=Ancylostoma duodenale TaxID=51022 RepID=A0A0C2GT00_9BILA|nr:hypothetical protein ANCDUO_05314 [Ancylostoma duodenale]